MKSKNADLDLTGIIGDSEGQESGSEYTHVDIDQSENVNFPVVGVGGMPSKNYFEQYPFILYFDYVTELVNFEGEERASEVMWAIHMVRDIESPFYKSTPDIEERKRQVARNFLNDVNFNWDEHKVLFENYHRFTCPREESRYIELHDIYDKQIMSLRASDSKDTINTLKSLKTILEGLEKAEAAFNKSREARRGVGGRSDGFFGRKRNG